MPYGTIVANILAKKESVENVRSELFKLIALARNEEGYATVFIVPAGAGMGA